MLVACGMLVSSRRRTGSPTLFSTAFSTSMNLTLHFPGEYGDRFAVCLQRKEKNRRMGLLRRMIDTIALIDALVAV